MTPPPATNPEPDPGLAAEIDAELKRLPAARAPASLIRNVLATIEARARLPWWQRAWWDWPLPAKAAFAVVTVTLAAVLAGSGLVLDGAASGQPQQPPGVDAFGFLDTLANAGGLLWQMAVQPLLLYAGAASVILYLLCVGLGTLCFQVALKRS